MDLNAERQKVEETDSEPQGPLDWFFDMLEEAKLSPFQKECVELLLDGFPVQHIALKLRCRKREVRLALEQVRKRLEAADQSFHAEPDAFARHLKFCIRNQGMRELAPPDLLTPPRYTKAPMGTDPVPASDRRLRQNSADAIYLYVAGRLTPETDRLSRYNDPKRDSYSGVRA